MQIIIIPNREEITFLLKNPVHTKLHSNIQGKISDSKTPIWESHCETCAALRQAQQPPVEVSEFRNENIFCCSEVCYMNESELVSDTTFLINQQYLPANR